MSEPATPTATVTVIKAPRRLPEARFRQAEQIRNVWHITPEVGTVVEAVLEPSYWAHVAKKLRPFDLIEVVPDDASWEATIRVRSTGPLSAHVGLLTFKDWREESPTASPSLNDLYQVIHKGPHWKWAVIRKADKEPMQKGFDTAEDANRWMVENSKTLLSGQKAA